MREYQYNYYTPTRIYGGAGAIENLIPELSKYGKKVLMIFDKNTASATGIYDYVVKAFKDNGFEWWEFDGVEPNPRLSNVIDAAKIGKENGVEMILAIGGGSVIDCSKAVRAAVYYDDLEDYDGLWAWGASGKDITKTLPLIDICTMASTGSEMDSGAVITNEHTHQKGGAFHGDLFAPKVSILDPKYTYSVPKRQVAAGVADIFIHTSEMYIGKNDGNFLIDGFAESVMKTCVKYGAIALADPTNFEARLNLQWAAPWSINGLSSAGRTSGPTLHGLQHPMGAFHDIIHGQGLAIIMPRWMRYILDTNEDTVNAIAKLGTNVFGVDASLSKHEQAEKAIEAVEDFFFNQLQIPTTLSAIGMDDSHFDEMAEMAARGARMMFVPLTKEQIVDIYRASL